MREPVSQGARARVRARDREGKKVMESIEREHACVNARAIKREREIEREREEKKATGTQKGRENKRAREGGGGLTWESLWWCACAFKNKTIEKARARTCASTSMNVCAHG